MGDGKGDFLDVPGVYIGQTHLDLPGGTPPLVRVLVLGLKEPLSKSPT